MYSICVYIVYLSHTHNQISQSEDANILVRNNSPLCSYIFILTLTLYSETFS